MLPGSSLSIEHTDAVKQINRLIFPAVTNCLCTVVVIVRSFVLISHLESIYIVSYQLQASRSNQLVGIRVVFPPCGCRQRMFFFILVTSLNTRLYCSCSSCTVAMTTVLFVTSALFNIASDSVLADIVRV